MGCSASKQTLATVTPPSPTAAKAGASAPPSPAGAPARIEPPGQNQAAGALGSAAKAEGKAGVAQPAADAASKLGDKVQAILSSDVRVVEGRRVQFRDDLGDLVEFELEGKELHFLINGEPKVTGLSRVTADGRSISMVGTGVAASGTRTTTVPVGQDCLVEKVLQLFALVEAERKAAIRQQTFFIMQTVFRRALELGNLQEAVKDAMQGDGAEAGDGSTDGGATPACTPLSADSQLPLAGSADGAAGSPAEGLVLGRFRVVPNKVLGQGGFCRVVLAEDVEADNWQVALKTFHQQAVRAWGDGLEGHFSHEVSTFQKLGLCVPHGLGKTRLGRSKSIKVVWSPKDVFVQMLDYSRVPGAEDPLRPGPAADGRFYSVLELGDEALSAFVGRRRDERNFVSFEELKLIARCLGAALACLHRHGLVHLDVKPENVLRFGATWKLIDLESAQPTTATELRTTCFTPMYAAPELGRAVLADAAVVDGSAQVLAGVSPHPKFDLWAAGLLLLDVLCHDTAFMETWGGFQAQHMMDGGMNDEEKGLGFQRLWYEWLVSPEPIKALEYCGAVASSAALLRTSPELQGLLAGLLAKAQDERLGSEDFLKHPFLALDVDLLEDAGEGYIDAGAVKRRKSRRDAGEPRGEKKEKKEKKHKKKKAKGPDGEGEDEGERPGDGAPGSPEGQAPPQPTG